MTSPISLNIGGRSYQIKKWLPISAPRTHFVCTLNPSRVLEAGKEHLRRLVMDGMNIVRINFSHVLTDKDRAGVVLLLNMIREVEEELCRPIGIMLDTKGPEFRVQRYEGSLEMRKGEKITLSPGEGECTKDKLFMRVPSGYSKLYDDLKLAHKNGNLVHIYIEDMKIALKMEDVLPGEGIVCTIERGGNLKGNKSINFSGCRLEVIAITKEDYADIDFGLRDGRFHYLARSFTTSPLVVSSIDEYMKAQGESPEPQMLQIAKPEEEKGMIDNLKGVISATAAVMIPRGDARAIGGPEKLPLLQARLMEEARRQGKPGILATDVLGQMETSPLPTRAESDNIFTGIARDRVSMVMFSGETATGDHPNLVVQTAVKHALVAEEYTEFENFFRGKLRTIFNEGETGLIEHQSADRYTASLVLGAIENAERLPGFTAFVPYTLSGHSANLAFGFYPKVPVVAITPTERAFYRMLLYRGVYPVLVDDVPNTMDGFQSFLKALVQYLGVAQVGQSITTTFASGGSGKDRTDTSQTIEVR